MFLIIKEAKEAILNFSKRTLKVLRTRFTKLISFDIMPIQKLVSIIVLTYKYLVQIFTNQNQQ